MAEPIHVLSSGNDEGSFVNDNDYFGDQHPSLQAISMSPRLPIGLGRSLFHTGQIRPLNTGFFSSISPLRAAPSSKPIASSITGLCFFSPSSFVRSAPRIPLGQLLSLHGQARSPFDGLARRAFSTGRPGWMRQTYFPKRGGGYGGGGSGGGGGGPSWFRNFRNRVDSIPPMVMVRPKHSLPGVTLAERLSRYTVSSRSMSASISSGNTQCSRGSASGILRCTTGWSTTLSSMKLISWPAGCGRWSLHVSVIRAGSTSL